MAVRHPYPANLGTKSLQICRNLSETSTDADLVFDTITPHKSITSGGGKVCD